MYKTQRKIHIEKNLNQLAHKIQTHRTNGKHRSYALVQALPYVEHNGLNLVV